MLASYVLSFTVVPAFSRFLLTETVPSGRRRHRPVRHVRARLRPAARCLWPAAGASCCDQRSFVLVCCRAAGRLTGVLFAVDRHRFLPHRRCRHHQAALSRAARHAHRGDREARAGRWRTRSARSSRPASCDTINDMIGRAALLQSGLRADRQCQRHGRRDPDPLKRRPSALGRLHARDARRSCPPPSPARPSISRPPISSARC